MVPNGAKLSHRESVSSSTGLVVAVIDENWGGLVVGSWVVGDEQALERYSSAGFRYASESATAP